MELDDRMIAEIAAQLGISNSRNMGQEALEHLASKSDEELEREIQPVSERAPQPELDRQFLLFHPA